MDLLGVIGDLYVAFGRRPNLSKAHQFAPGFSPADTLGAGR